MDGLKEEEPVEPYHKIGPSKSPIENSNSESERGKKEIAEQQIIKLFTAFDSQDHIKMCLSGHTIKYNTCCGRSVQISVHAVTSPNQRNVFYWCLTSFCIKVQYRKISFINHR